MSALLTTRALYASFLLLPLSAFASEAKSSKEQSETLNELEEVHVYGHEATLALPVVDLDQSELEKAQAGNMMKSLSELPGVANASYGEGVGRPVIRGLSANRVKLSVNGSTTADVSGMSADHSPMMDITNANNVEIIYGPNTLRFGGGAMGGLINVNDGRFHQKAFSGVNARILSSYGSNANTAQSAASIEFGGGASESQAHIGYLDVYYLDSDNYTAGELNGSSDEVLSSSSEAAGGSAAYNYVDNSVGSIGIALTYSDYEYGLPNPKNEDVRVTPEQSRVDIQGNLLALTDSIELWENKFSYIDYSHQELAEGSPNALFEKQVAEYQSALFFHLQSEWLVTTGIQLQYENLELCHDDNGTCEEIPDFSSFAWDGRLGSNLNTYTDDGYSFSHGTPMPLAETYDAGLYIIVGKTFNELTAEFGLRYDSRTIKTDPSSIDPDWRREKGDYDDVNFNPISVSAGLSWDHDMHRLAVNVSHSERAPTSDEMFYNGDHHATFSFQLDNIDLDVESANSLDVTWQVQLGDVLIDTAVFYYDFDDYIYNDRKSTPNPFHPGDPVYRYEQNDAWFVGGEIVVEYMFTDSLLLFAGADTVRAQLKEGVGQSNNKNLPRTPPASLRSGLKWQSGGWDLEGNFHYYAEQDDVAANESVSDAYTTVNAYAAYRIEMGVTALTLQLKANNLLDEYGVNHVSYLKDYSPVQGRNIEAGFIFEL